MASRRQRRAERDSTAADLSLHGLGEGFPTPANRLAAFATCVTLAAVALIAIHFGSTPAPKLPGFLPIVATSWALADLMTAFLLLAQFYVNGTTFFTVLAAAYALSGLLTLPYILAFPGVLSVAKLSLVDQQLSISLWVIWHIAFPVIVIVSVLCDPKLKMRVYSRDWTRRATFITVAATVGCAATFTAYVFTHRAGLPHLIADGKLLAPFTHGFAPVASGLNVLGCCLLLRRVRTLSTLHLWLLVALFTSMLDSVLNASSVSRNSYGWYVGKIETVTTASVVLVMLLTEVTGLYRRLAQMATVDPLTQLFNRRAFEDHSRLVSKHAKRHSGSLALLVVDADFFKGFNDAYGHADGDECLRRLAAVLRKVATRALDHVARVGGEEFVVLLPETPLEGAIVVAERILERVAKAAIPYAGYAPGHVTVSVGVGFVKDARAASSPELFDVADRALYEAKARGRNTYVVSVYDPAVQGVRLDEPSSDAALSPAASPHL